MPEASITSTPTAPTGTGTTIPNIALDTHQEDDILVIHAGWKGNQAPTVLTDWTHWFTNATGTATNGCGQGWWWRRVGPGETVSSPTLTLGGTAVERKAISYRIRGADIDNPANGFWLKQQTVGNSTTPTPPGITTLEPNYLIIHGVTCRGNSGVTPPTGYTEEEDLPEGTILCVEGSSKVQATAVTLSGQAAAISSNRWVAAIIAIPSKDYVKFRSQTSQTASGVTQITGTAPTGVTNDDFYDQADGLLAIVKAAGAGVNITAQDGAQWTKLTDFDREISGTDTVALFEAHAQATNNWQFNRPSSGNIALQLIALRNVHQTDFIGNLHSRQNSGTPAPWDAQNRQNTKSTVYGIIAADADTNNVHTAPSGYTERSDGAGIGICDQVFESGGATPSASWTTTNAVNVTGLVEILSVSGVAAAVDEGFPYIGGGYYG